MFKTTRLWGSLGSKAPHPRPGAQEDRRPEDGMAAMLCSHRGGHATAQETTAGRPSSARGLSLLHWVSFCAIFSPFTMQQPCDLLNEERETLTCSELSRKYDCLSGKLFKRKEFFEKSWGADFLHWWPDSGIPELNPQSPVLQSRKQG